MMTNNALITIEYLSSSECRSKDIKITYGFSDTPFGEALIAATPKGICYLAFADDREQTVSELKCIFPFAEYTTRTDEYQQQALSFFSDDWKNRRPVKLHLKGTDFQWKVWEILLQIPFAGLTTYGEIAGKINHPKAVRAVGTAVGNNPVSFLIPCHRVIRSDGAMGGYHWGLSRKIDMINWEKERLNQPEMNH
ncbi:Bifunctional transcriptional activator/DNA repair enzyme Ada [termite gut metagenome]|uniref:methylated-DNA--[protein]-cysteine S-methyltransferase n=1 Tax=termite gut metagenome TaxID=433724 RepID=A0A5J4R2W2_9ZZZZ